MILVSRDIFSQAVPRHTGTWWIPQSELRLPVNQSAPGDCEAHQISNRWVVVIRARRWFQAASCSLPVLAPPPSFGRALESGIQWPRCSSHGSLPFLAGPPSRRWFIGSCAWSI